MKTVKYSLFILSCAALMGLALGCGPSEKLIISDFKGIFSKEAGNGLIPIVTSVGPGGGDAENVYEHIEFDVVAEKDIAVKTGWFSGLTLHKNQKLRGGEIVILYQKKKNSPWSMTSYYELLNLPDGKTN